MKSYPIYYRSISGNAVMKIEQSDEFHCVRILHTVGEVMDLAYEFMKGKKAFEIIEIIKNDLHFELCEFNDFNSKVAALERKMKEVCEHNLKK